MGRTTVNLIGNCVATVVIARWENDFNYYKMVDFISKKNKNEIKMEKIEIKKEEELVKN